MAHWLVQSNPAKWRVREFFADGNQLESWSITRYRDQIQEGDDTQSRIMTVRVGSPV